MSAQLHNSSPTTRCSGEHTCAASLVDALDNQRSAAKAELWEHFDSTLPDLTEMKNALSKLLGVIFTVYSQGCIEPWTKDEEARVCNRFLRASNGLRELKNAKEWEHKVATAGQSSILAWKNKFSRSSREWQDAVEANVAVLSDDVKKHIAVIRQCVPRKDAATEGCTQAPSLDISISTA